MEYSKKGKGETVTQQNNTFNPINDPPKQPIEAELKTTATHYHNVWGVSVIPTRISWDNKKQRYDKKFLCNSWSQWQTQVQTEAEFLSLNWFGANGLTAILGPQTKNGSYLAVIDYDVKGASEDVKQKGLAVLAEFPQTRREQTVNHGIHLFFWSKKPAKINNNYHSQTGIELLGANKLCVIAPSFGYSTLNDYYITEVDDIEQLFVQTMEKHNITNKPKKSTPPIKLAVTFNGGNKKPRPCIQHMLSQQLTGADGHQARLAIAAEMKKCGWTNQETTKLFEGQQDYNYERTLEQVKSANPDRTLKCETIKKLGYCQPNCPHNKTTDKQQQQEQNKQTIHIYRPTIITNDFIAEMTWCRKETEPPCYMKYIFQEDKFEQVTSISLGEVDEKGRNIVYVPPFNGSLKKGLVIVPMTVEEATFVEVFNKIDQFASVCYDAGEQEDLVKLLTRVVMGGWFLDRFITEPMFDIAGSGKFAPIIPIRGPSQSGKNRLATVLRLLSYRPYFEMSTSRIPSLYRPMDLWKGTLVLDEADFAQTNEKSELIHYLNCRATGTPVSRQNSQDPSVTDTFDNFGITILTQRRGFDDNATESRAIPFYSEKSDKKIPVAETDEMIRFGLQLQNMLLYLRLKYYRQVKIDKNVWLDEVSDSRFMAALLPMLAIAQFEPDVKETMVRNVVDVEKAKIREKSSSMDSQLINFLWEKIKEGLFVKHSILDQTDKLDVYYVQDERGTGAALVSGVDGGVVRLVLTVSLLAEHFKWNVVTVGKALKSLGIARKELDGVVVKVGKKSQRVIFFEPSRMERRLREFVQNYKIGEINELVTGVTQVTLSTSGGSQNFLAGNSECGLFGVCFFCGKTLTGDDKVVRDDFTGGKLAHQYCYVEKQGQLKNAAGVSKFVEFVSKVENVEKRSSPVSNVSCACCGIEDRSNCVVYFKDGLYCWVCENCYQQILPLLRNQSKITTIATMPVVSEQTERVVDEKVIHYKPLLIGEPVEQCPTCSDYPVQYVVEHKGDDLGERLCGVCLKQRVDSQLDVQWIRKDDFEVETVVNNNGGVS
jgi:hypothetical protein